MKSPSRPRSSGPRRGGSAGFTLVEILIAAVIAALLSTALVHVFSGVLNLSRTVRRGDEIGRDAQLAITLIRRDVSSAARILSVSPTTLNLLTAGGDLVRYSWGGGNTDSLTRRLNAGAAEVVAVGVDTLAFGFQTVSRPYNCEMYLPDTLEKIVMKFEEGDWDGLVASTDCAYRSRGERKVEDDRWCAEEFWQTPEDFVAFSRAAVRVKAKDHLPAEVDLLVEVYEADATPDAYPGTLLAESRIDRDSLTADYEWYEVLLTTVDSSLIVAGGHYWLVLRPDGSGGHTYAGHVQYERIKNCDSGEWPQNGMCYRESDDAGGSWKSGQLANEGFYRVHGLQITMRLTEVTETLADTIGVSYLLTLRHNQELETRAGFIALHNL